MVNAPIDTCDPDNYIYQFAQSIPMISYKWMVFNSGGIQSGYNQLAGFYSLPSNWKTLHYDRWADLWNSVKNNKEDKIKKWHRQKQAFSFERFSNKVKKWTIPDTGHIGGFTSSKAMPYWDKIIACHDEIS